MRNSLFEKRNGMKAKPSEDWRRCLLETKRARDCRFTLRHFAGYKS